MDHSQHSSGIFNGELCLLMCPYNLNNSLVFLENTRIIKEVLVSIQIVLKQIFSVSWCCISCSGETSGLVLTYNGAQELCHIDLAVHLGGFKHCKVNSLHQIKHPDGLKEKGKLLQSRLVTETDLHCSVCPNRNRNFCDFVQLTPINLWTQNGPFSL